jgi:hypothetical protein
MVEREFARIERGYGRSSRSSRSSVGRGDQEFRSSGVQEFRVDY